MLPVRFSYRSPIGILIFLSTIGFSTPVGSSEDDTKSASAPLPTQQRHNTRHETVVALDLPAVHATEGPPLRSRGNSTQLLRGQFHRIHASACDDTFCRRRRSHSSAG